MLTEQQLSLPKGNHISITALLAQIYTHLLNPVELHHASCKERWDRTAEMNKPEEKEQSQTESQSCKN